MSSHFSSLHIRDRLSALFPNFIHFRKTVERHSLDLLYPNCSAIALGFTVWNDWPRQSDPHNFYCSTLIERPKDLHQLGSIHNWLTQSQILDNSQQQQETMRLSNLIPLILWNLEMSNRPQKHINIIIRDKTVGYREFRTPIWRNNPLARCHIGFINSRNQCRHDTWHIAIQMPACRLCGLLTCQARRGTQFLNKESHVRIAPHLILIHKRSQNSSTNNNHM